MTYMFNYRICNVFDSDIFESQCAALVKHIPGLTGEHVLMDVDGSQIHTYKFSNGKSLKVTNDKLFGIEIDSEVDINQFFKKNKAD